MTTREEMELKIDEFGRQMFAIHELTRTVRQGVRDCHELRDKTLRATHDHYRELAECLVNLSQFDREIAIQVIAVTLPVIERSPFMRESFAVKNDTE